MTQVAYTLLVGFPLCVFLCAIGLMLICTIILAPVGIACVALGVKWLTLPRKVVVR